MAEWKLVFQPKMDDVVRLDKFLIAKLDPAYKHRLGHGARVIIDHGLRDKNEAWKVAEFIRHQSPLGEGLRYMIAGYEGTTIIYLSYCPKCRKGDEGRHDEHS